MFDSSTRTLILFNGPPGCGKDTAADLVLACANKAVYQTKFARAMKLNVMAALGIEPDLALFDRIKDIPQERFAGKTLRQIVIAYSEEFAKPNFGQDFFGKLTRDEVIHRLYGGDDLNGAVPQIVTVSDSGFPVEGMTLVNAVDPGYDEEFWDRVILIRLHRQGCDFSRDSRSYWSLAERGYTQGEEYDVLNNGTLLDLETQLARLLPDLMTVRQYQIQVQLPTDPIGEPAWAVVADNVKDLETAFAITETARRGVYSTRLVRIIRKGNKPEVQKVIYPGDAPVYVFEPATLQPASEIVS